MKDGEFLEDYKTKKEFSVEDFNEFYSGVNSNEFKFAYENYDSENDLTGAEGIALADKAYYQKMAQKNHSTILNGLNLSDYQIRAKDLSKRTNAMKMDPSDSEGDVERKKTLLSKIMHYKKLKGSSVILDESSSAQIGKAFKTCYGVGEKVIEEMDYQYSLFPKGLKD